MRKSIVGRREALMLIAALAGGGILLDLLAGDVSAWFGRHQFVTALIAEALLLAAVYVGFDHLAGQAEGRRWRVAAAEPLRLLVNAAERMDNRVEALISSDRKHLDRSASGCSGAREAYGELKRRIDANQPLLTASPYMIEFLPACIDLETYARYLLAPRARGASDDALHIQWYDQAVWTFIEKMVEGVAIRELSEPWLLRIPETAYRCQMKEASRPADREFLATYLAVRREAALKPPSSP